MKKLVAALLVAGLSTALFAGCGGSSNSQQSADTQAEQTASTAAESTVEAAAESTEESADGSYKIYVLDANDGTPIEGAKVQFCSDTQCMMADTDKAGLATFDQEPGDYTAHLLVAPQGYEGTEEEIALTADERTATFEIGKTEGTDSTAAADQGESDLPATEKIKQQAEWTAEKTGFTFEVPEYVKDLKGEYNIGDNGVAYSEDGTYVAAFTYTPKTVEDYKELEAKAQGATQEEVMALQMDYYKNMRSIFNVFAVKEGTDLSTTTIAGMNLPELGTAGGYTYYYQLMTVEDTLTGLEDVSDEMVEELKMLSEKAADYPERITLNGPKIPVELTQVGTKISFEATDLDGNTVKSEDLFKDHKVTMINLWGTFCTPCKYELPKLEEMDKELAEKDCQIIGIVSDALTEDGNIEKAKEMLSEAGVTYVNIAGTDEINTLLTTNNYPTTYYVDSEGNVLTAPVVGALFDEYAGTLEEALAAVK